MVFLITNAGFAWLSIGLDVPFLGYGYFAASFISLTLAYYALDHKLKHLEYLTFAFQPIAIHRKEEIL